MYVCTIISCMAQREDLIAKSTCVCQYCMYLPYVSCVRIKACIVGRMYVCILRAYVCIIHWFISIVCVYCEYVPYACIISRMSCVYIIHVYGT